LRLEGKKMRHCVYIRLKYVSFPSFLKRVDFFCKTALPSLIAQEGEFDVQILVKDEAHQKIINHVCSFQPVLQYSFAGYDIQTRHDADDIIFPGYIEAIQSAYDGNPKIVTFQLKKYLWEESKTFVYGSRYTKNKCSMFSSLLCPPPGLNIFSYRHLDLARIAPVAVLEKDLCRLVIHNDNLVSGIKSTDYLEPDGNTEPSNAH
jgi:hypothetical protein